MAQSPTTQPTAVSPRGLSPLSSNRLDLTLEPLARVQIAPFPRAGKDSRICTSFARPFGSRHRPNQFLSQRPKRTAHGPCHSSGGWPIGNWNVRVLNLGARPRRRHRRTCPAHTLKSKSGANAFGPVPAIWTPLEIHDTPPTPLNSRRPIDTPTHTYRDTGASWIGPAFVFFP